MIIHSCMEYIETEPGDLRIHSGRKIWSIEIWLEDDNRME